MSAAAGITRIIGVGNPLMADDGVGIKVIERLREATLPESVELIDGGCGGIKLLPLLTGCRQLIIVDAADFGAAPGRIKVIDNADLQEVPLPESHGSHHLGLAELLNIASQLQPLPPCSLYLIQVESCHFNTALSRAVSSASKTISSKILDFINKQI